MHSVDAVMQAGNLVMPLLWETAALESGRGYVPATGFEYQLHETLFHLDFGFLFPVEWAVSELWIKVIIKPFGLVEELLIPKKGSFWPYIAQKKRFTPAQMIIDQIGF